MNRKYRDPLDLMGVNEFRDRNRQDLVVILSTLKEDPKLTAIVELTADRIGRGRPVSRVIKTTDEGLLTEIFNNQVFLRWSIGPSDLDFPSLDLETYKSADFVLSALPRKKLPEAVPKEQDQNQEPGPVNAEFRDLEQPLLDSVDSDEEPASAVSSESTESKEPPEEVPKQSTSISLKRSSKTKSQQEHIAEILFPKDEKEDKIMFPMNSGERNRYHQFMQAVNKIMAPSISKKYLAQMACLDENQSLNIQPQDLLASDHVIFSNLWHRAEGHDYFVGVTQADKDPEFYIYNGGKSKDLPPFTKIEKLALHRAIVEWLRSLFKGIPPVNFGAVEFSEKILKQLSIDIIRSEDDFRKILPGLAFKNGYFLIDGSPLLRFVPFSEQFVVTQRLPGTIPVEFVMPQDVPVFMAAQMQQTYPKPGSSLNPTLLLSTPYVALGQSAFNPQEQVTNTARSLITKEFLKFVYNICEGDPLKLLILRSMIQRVVMARVEGQPYQHGFWLHGVAASGKSTWSTILQTLSPGRYVELSKVVNQFTGDSVLNRDLMLISDVTWIDFKQSDLLRVILGRDPIRIEKKHKNEIQVVKAYCQVLVTTNAAPENFPVLWSRTEIRDKLFPLEFKNRIPDEYMHRQLPDLISKWAHQFFIFGLFTPRKWLEEQIRTKSMINKYIPKSEIRKDYLHDYIEDRLVKLDPNAKDRTVMLTPRQITCSKEQLRADFRDWAERTGVLKEISPDFHSKVAHYVCEALEADYGFEKIKRKDRIPGPERPWGYNKVFMIMPPDYEKDPSKYNLMSVKPPSKEEKVVLDYKTLTEMQPFKPTTITNEEVDYTQQQILKLRGQEEEYLTFEEGFFHNLSSSPNPITAEDLEPPILQELKQEMVSVEVEPIDREGSLFIDHYGIEPQIEESLLVEAEPQKPSEAEPTSLEEFLEGLFGESDTPKSPST